MNSKLIVGSRKITSSSTTCWRKVLIFKVLPHLEKYVLETSSSRNSGSWISTCWGKGTSVVGEIFDDSYALSTNSSLILQLKPFPVSPSRLNTQVCEQSSPYFKGPCQRYINHLNIVLFTINLFLIFSSDIYTPPHPTLRHTHTIQQSTLLLMQGFGCRGGKRGQQEITCVW